MHLHTELRELSPSENTRARRCSASSVRVRPASRSRRLIMPTRRRSKPRSTIGKRVNPVDAMRWTTARSGSSGWATIGSECARSAIRIEQGAVCTECSRCPLVTTPSSRWSPSTRDTAAVDVAVEDRRRRLCALPPASLTPRAQRCWCELLPERKGFRAGRSSTRESGDNRAGSPSPSGLTAALSVP